MYLCVHACICVCICVCAYGCGYMLTAGSYLWSSDFQPRILYHICKQKMLRLYLFALMLHKNCEDSAMIGDYYGVCSRKIGGVLTELCTRELSVNNFAIVNIRGRNFSEITIAFVAPCTILTRSCFRESSRYLRVV